MGLLEKAAKRSAEIANEHQGILALNQKKKYQIVHTMNF